MGDPTRASVEKGERILEAQVTNVCDLIEMARGHQVTIKERSVPL